MDILFDFIIAIHQYRMSYFSLQENVLLLLPFKEQNIAAFSISSVVEFALFFLRTPETCFFVVNVFFKDLLLR